MDKIVVAIRIRNTPAVPVVEVAGHTVVCGAHRFSFDKVLGGDTSQLAAFETVALPFLTHALDGYNACILAYGATGAGKTHTMEAICSHTLTRLFGETSRRRATATTVHLSYCEVYNENAYDLLAAGAGPLRVRELPSLGPYVEGLSEVHVALAAAGLAALAAAAAVRRTAATRLNERSSRSHALATLHIRQTRLHESGKVHSTLELKLTLVDLAGSERAKATLGHALRLKEGSSINQLLSTLGRVISSLASGRPGVVPFRELTLTWLLKELLGGNSRTCVVGCVLAADLEETVSTLRYVDRAKHITTAATPGIVSGGVDVEEMERELERLRSEVASGDMQTRMDVLQRTQGWVENRCMVLQLQNQQAEAAVRCANARAEELERWGEFVVSEARREGYDYEREGRAVVEAAERLSRTIAEDLEGLAPERVFKAGA